MPTREQMIKEIISLLHTLSAERLSNVYHLLRNM